MQLHQESFGNNDLNLHPKQLGRDEQELLQRNRLNRQLTSKVQSQDESNRHMRILHQVLHEPLFLLADDWSAHRSHQHARGQYV